MKHTFSIITATYNSEKTIRDCLESVRLQKGKTEHIIIDGGSDDGTIDIVKSYSYMTKIVSEPDNGIYDAMNKGISMAKGDIIGILNSDDFYVSRDVLTKVDEEFTFKAIDTCYGDLVYVDAMNTSKIIRKWKSKNYSKKSFYWGWMPAHPTFFVRRCVYQEYGTFNLELGSSADYELMLRFLFKNEITSSYIPEVLVKMRTGGISNASLKNRIKANQMDRKAWRVNGVKAYPWTLYCKPLRKLAQYFPFS